MKKDGYYSSGQFARMAGVTLRTIRYYDQHDILKPSLVSESGARFYTDTDFARLQQILLLKYLGFSLEDIREMTIEDPDSHFMLNALNVQLKLVQDRIEQMQLVEKTLKDTAQAISEEHTVDWSRMLDLIHLTVMEKSLKNQYQNASNISSRINLHSLYSVNQEGWFPWVCQQCQIHEGMNILELGCLPTLQHSASAQIIEMRGKCFMMDCKKIFAEYGYETWRKRTTRCAALAHRYYCMHRQCDRRPRTGSWSSYGRRRCRHRDRLRAGAQRYFRDYSFN